MYVLAVGALTVYVHHPFLALFAPTPYSFPPVLTPEGAVDLSSHLTNTCLQGSETPSIVVSTLSNLSSHVILGDGSHQGELLGEQRVEKIESDVSEIVSQTFRAAISSGSGFQVGHSFFANLCIGD